MFGGSLALANTDECLQSHGRELNTNRRIVLFGTALAAKDGTWAIANLPNISSYQRPSIQEMVFVFGNTEQDGMVFAKVRRTGHNKANFAFTTARSLVFALL